MLTAEEEGRPAADGFAEHLALLRVEADRVTVVAPAVAIGSHIEVGAVESDERARPAGQGTHGVGPVHGGPVHSRDPRPCVGSHAQDMETHRPPGTQVPGELLVPHSRRQFGTGRRWRRGRARGPF
ncbi:hypothetical protein D3C59_12980 [Streptomyces sp. SHP22-7]|nr:hypothetical protein D3C59_12980 [Streptomyces sp. SHP22-7]